MVSNSGSDDHDSLIGNSSFYSNTMTQLQTTSLPHGQNSQMPSHHIHHQQIQQHNSVHQQMHINMLNENQAGPNSGASFVTLNKRMMLDSPTDKNRYFDMTDINSSNCFNMNTQNGLIELNSANIFIDNNSNNPNSITSA